MIPGEYVCAADPITCNEGYEAAELEVLNNGNRPIQVGSHFHFYEANAALAFDRAAAWGKRLDIPAGTAVRFESGQRLTVPLVNMGGRRRVFGFNAQVNGYLDGEGPIEKPGDGPVEKPSGR